MTVTNGYATLAEFKLWVTVRGGQTISTDTNDDAVIEDIIEQVSRTIDNLTARRFYAEGTDSTRYFQTSDPFKCEIDDLSAAPTSVSVDLNNARSYTAIVADTDFELLPYNALTLGNPYTDVIISPLATAISYWPTDQPKAIKIVGKFGYPSVPLNIRNDCLAIAHNVWMSRQGQTSGGKITITAGGVVIRPEDIPPLVMADLLTYRRYR